MFVFSNLFSKERVEEIRRIDAQGVGETSFNVM